MAVYVHRCGERVETVDGSLEDTRLGLAALDPQSGWTRPDQPAPEPPTDPAPQGEPAAEPASPKPTAASPRRRRTEE